MPTTTTTTTTTTRRVVRKPKPRLVKRVRKVVVRTAFVKGKRAVVRRKAASLAVKPAQVIEVAPVTVRELPHKTVSELTVKERQRLPYSGR